MGAVTGHAFACSMRGLLRPWTMCVSAASGQFGPKGTVCRYGMLHAQNAKSVLADVFQYLIVVCSMSKKSLFSWQIPRAEFLIHFQDPIFPIRAGWSPEVDIAYMTKRVVRVRCARGVVEERPRDEATGMRFNTGTYSRLRAAVLPWQVKQSCNKQRQVWKRSASSCRSWSFHRRPRIPSAAS